MLEKEFWKNKKLCEFTKEEWELLCDRCGKCCLVKLENVDTNKIHYTNVSCKLLCTKTANCTNYKNRKKIVKECVVLNQDNIKNLEWMPKTCSYRLINDGKDLPEWHHLISGSIEKMVRKNICVRNKVTNEKKIRKNDITNYIYDWE